VLRGGVIGMTEAEGTQWLVDMGFAPTQAEQALKNAGGDVHQAVVHLLSLGGTEASASRHSPTSDQGYLHGDADAETSMAEVLLLSRLAENERRRREKEEEFLQEVELARALELSENYHRSRASEDVAVQSSSPSCEVSVESSPAASVSKPRRQIFSGVVHSSVPVSSQEESCMIDASHAIGIDDLHGWSSDSAFLRTGLLPATRQSSSCSPHAHRLTSGSPAGVVSSSPRGVLPVSAFHVSRTHSKTRSGQQSSTALSAAASGVLSSSNRRR